MIVRSFTKPKSRSAYGVGFSKTLQHHIVLPLALVAVGLHVGARRSRKVAKAAQHFIGATWNEARRDNWPYALLARAANGFDFLNKRRRVTHSLRRQRRRDNIRGSRRDRP